MNNEEYIEFLEREISIRDRYKVMENTLNSIMYSKYGNNDAYFTIYRNRHTSDEIVSCDFYDKEHFFKWQVFNVDIETINDTSTNSRYPTEDMVYTLFMEVLLFNSNPIPQYYNNLETIYSVQDLINKNYLWKKSSKKFTATNFDLE